MLFVELDKLFPVVQSVCLPVCSPPARWFGECLIRFPSGVRLGSAQGACCRVVGGM